MKLYRSLIGSLIYVTNTWLDICFCDEYLKSTLDFGLHLACKGNEIYFVFAYADWGCDLDSKHSTSRMLHKLGNFIVH
ncbi:hypothetical protein CY35_06G042100 [Sphagnum magellanicum]|nr:hypothetical protein CY35_06G042100 [Sphagnum magellanicum]